MDDAEDQYNKDKESNQASEDISDQRVDQTNDEKLDRQSVYPPGAAPPDPGGLKCDVCSFYKSSIS